MERRAESAALERSFAYHRAVGYGGPCLRIAVGALLALSLTLGKAEARDTFSAPTGDLGANLSTEFRRVRAHAELSYFTMSNQYTATGLGRDNATTHLVTLTVGAGLRLSKNFELTFGYASEGYWLVGDGDGEHAQGTLDRGVAFGNVAIGGNYIRAFGPNFRLKLGALVAFGPWNRESTDGTVQITAGTSIHGYQDSWYYWPDQLHLVFPARLEFDALKELVVTLDVQPDVGIGLDGASSNLLVISAPGLAYWPMDRLMFGARVPVQVGSTFVDSTQVAVEPFVRFDITQAVFIATRFTLNLDPPFGFSFDSSDPRLVPKSWGWHMAFGGAF